jgi:hypothetical protein
MNFFDIILIIIIIALMGYALKSQKFKLLYTFLREIFIFALAAKYAFAVALKLISWQILSPATTLGVQLLIGFGIAVFLIIYFVRLVEYIFLVINRGNIYKLTYIGNIIIVILSAIIAVTASAFLLMQLTFVKKHSQTYVNKSKTYPYIRKTYTDLLSTKFVKTNIINRSPTL